ncbi:MAG: peptide chain release factor N(5)-glutamine methyltransferase [Betaproteobacteria bacterium]|nr:peptide chain release factor N(5)-glutamine methyltransferase [Betaproteobacteria bacterium]
MTKLGFDQLLDTLSERWQAAPDKPEETPESTLRALWLCAAGTPTSAAAAIGAALPALDSAALDRLEALLQQRLAGVPLGHLTGRQRFMGLELAVSPAALVPRIETELLGRHATALLATMLDQSPAREALRAIDLCTGCGNLALALATANSRVQVDAADLSGEAIDLARHNALALGLAPRIRFFVGDLFAALPSPPDRADLIVCNPPYIPSARVGAMRADIADHEPHAAFDGGPLGISIIERLMREAPAHLVPGGWLGFEVGAGQARGVRKRLERLPSYDAIEEVADANGTGRALFARTRPAAGA